jgi:hypothetical protein
MNYKKVIAVGLTSATLLSGAITTVSAAQMQLTRASYVYNAKGKKIRKVKLAKGKKVKILGTTLIKGNKYYRIGKNQYIKVASLKASKPTNRPATQAERDAFIAYLKQINSITENSNPENEKYEMSSAKDKDKFLDAVERAHFVEKNKNSTFEDLNNEKTAVEQAYNRLDGQRYLLPCSQADFVHGRYTLTDTDKTAILALANKVEGSTDAQFASPTNQNIKYTHNDLYPGTMRTGFYLKFAKQ